MPAINIHLTAEEHQMLRVTAASLNTTLQQLVVLSIDFTRRVAVEYLRNHDGTAFDVTQLVYVIRGDSEAMHLAWAGLDAHFAYLRSLEHLVSEVAVGDSAHAPAAQEALSREPLFRKSLDEDVRTRE